MRISVRRITQVISCLGIVAVLTVQIPMKVYGTNSQERQGLNTLQEKESSHIPMFDVDPRYIPQELRPPSYMQRLDVQRNITNEIRIDDVRIDWMNHRLELFISGFFGDPYFIRVSQELPNGGSLLVPNTDSRRPTEGELIIFGSHTPMIFPNLTLEKGKYYIFTIFDNHNVPQDSFRFQSPYDFGPREYVIENLEDIYGKGEDKKEEVKLVQTNDLLTHMIMATVLMTTALVIYIITLPKNRRKSV